MTLCRFVPQVCQDILELIVSAADKLLSHAVYCCAKGDYV